MVGIRGLQISTSCHCRPIRKAKIPKWQYQVLLKVWNSNSDSLLLEMQTGPSTLGDSSAVSYCITQQSPSKIYIQQIWKCMSTQNCIQMFMEALFIIPKNWKQKLCPSTDEWVNKLWHSHTLGYYSAWKRKELLNHEKTRMSLKYLLLSEVVDLKRLIFRFQFYGILEKNETIKMVNRLVVARGSEGGRLKLYRWNTGSFLGWWHYSGWYCNDGYIILYICQNPQNFTTTRMNLKLV